MEGNRYTLDEIGDAMKAIGLDSEVVGNVFLQMTKTIHKKESDSDRRVAGPRLVSASHSCRFVCPKCGGSGCYRLHRHWEYVCKC